MKYAHIWSTSTFFNRYLWHIAESLGFWTINIQSSGIRKTIMPETIKKPWGNPEWHWKNYKRPWGRHWEYWWNPVLFNFCPLKQSIILSEYILWIKNKFKHSSNLNYTTSGLILHLINCCCASEFGIVNMVSFVTSQSNGQFSEIYLIAYFNSKIYSFIFKTEIRWVKWLYILQK